MSTVTLKVFMDNGFVSKKVQFEAKCQIYDVYKIIEDKVLNGAAGENYGLFLPSADNINTGIWLEPEKTLDFYLLRDGDSIHYLNRIRTLKLRLLDGSVKTLKVDDSQPVSILLVQICTRIGITNHDEYALCRDEPEVQSTEEDRMSLKRKHQPPSGEGTLPTNAKMEMLKRKLKTDDDVNWVDPKKTLREQEISPTEVLLLKRRLFYSDRNIDARDPVQLGLLYVQARDAILDGTHPVTEQKAVEFAGIQCQIQFGDFVQTKHTTEFIDSTLKDFIPEHYIRTRNIKKKILKEHQKHQGLPELEAKLLYIRTARSLTTYGVTFFLVKEKQKGKNKLVLRLLGINAESVLRVDENTREILEIWPLTHVKRWAPTTTTFTLDFGEYNKNVYVVQTSEALRIIEVLTGYIDLILKKRQEKEGLDMDMCGLMCEEQMQSFRANNITMGDAMKVQTEYFVGPKQIVHTDGERMAATENVTITTQHQITTDVSEQNNKRMRYGSLTGDEVERSGHFILRRIINKISVAAQGMLTMTTGSALQGQLDVLNDNVPKLKEALVEDTRIMDDKAKKVYMTQYDKIGNGVQQLAMLVNEKEPYNLGEIHSTAAGIFDASTKLYCFLDPTTKRRSQLLLASRKSFQLEDAESDKRLSQIMFAIIEDINRNMTTAENELENDDGKPILNMEHLHELKCKAAFKLARCNAATAVLLASHIDPDNIDYSAAVTSFNTLSLMAAGVISDVKLLSKSLSEEGREHLLNVIHEFCIATKQLCDSAKDKDPAKINECSNNFAKHSGELLHSVSPNEDPDLENEIITSAKQIADEISELILKIKKAIEIATPEKEEKAVEKASAITNNNAKRLFTCAKLTAASIHEPHCQSALMTSAENTASSIEGFTESWKPVLEGDQHKGLVKELMKKTTKVEEDLDALKGICGDRTQQFHQLAPELPQKSQSMEIDIDEEELMKDILSATADDAVKVLTWVNVIQDEMPQPTTAAAESIKNDMKIRIALCNSGAANLLIAHADPNKIDYVAEVESIDNIINNVPVIVREIHRLRLNADENLKSLLTSAKGLCSSDTKELKDLILRFGDDTNKILHLVCDADDVKNEELVMKMTSAIVQKVTEINSHAYEVRDRLEDEQAKSDITNTVQHCAHVTQIFSTCAKVTSPTIHSASCQESLYKATETLAKAVHNVINVLPENSRSAASSEINTLLSDLQSANAKIAANHLLFCHENISSKQTPKRVSFSYLGKYANELVDAVHHLEEQEQRLKDNPDDPIIQNQLRDAINKLQELLRLLQNNEKESVKINVKRSDHFKVKTEALLNENNPKILCDRAKDLLNELQNITKGQKSSEARNRLAPLSKKLADAARDLEEAIRKHDKSPNDEQLQKDVKQAMMRLQKTVIDLQHSFDREARLSGDNKNKIKDIEASIDLKHLLTSLNPNSSDMRMADAITMQLSDNHSNSKNIKSDSEVGDSMKKPVDMKDSHNGARKSGELLDQNKVQNATKTTIDSVTTIVPRAQSLTNEVIDAIKQLEKPSNTNDSKIEVNKKMEVKSVNCLSPNSTQLLTLSFENVKQQKKPDALKKAIELLIKDIDKLTQSESPTAQNTLKVFAQHLTKAIRTLESAEENSTQKPYDVAVQKELRKAIADIHNIIKKQEHEVLQIASLGAGGLTENYVSEKQKMIDASLQLINAEKQSDVPNTKVLQVFLQIDQKLLKDIQDKVFTEQSTASLALVNKLANVIKSQEELQTTPEAKRLILNYAQRLADAADNLDGALKHAKEKHNDKLAQQELKRSEDNLQAIIKELFPDVNVDKKSSLDLSPEPCETLRLACVNALNESEVSSIKDNTRVIIKHLEKQIGNQTLDINTKGYLQTHLVELNDAVHQLEVADTIYNSNRHDEKAKKDVDDLCKRIRELISDLLKSLINVNKEEPKQLFIEVKLLNAHNLLSTLDDIVKNDDPNLFGNLTKMTVNEIQIQAHFQETLEARDYLESYRQQFINAVKEIEDSVKSKDKKKSENAVDSIKLIAKDLKNKINDISNSVDKPEEKYLQLTAFINKEQTADNILQISKELIKYIGIIADGESDLEKRKSLELCAQQIRENLEALEKAQLNYQKNFKDENAKSDVDDLCKKIQKLFIDFLKLIKTVDKKETNRIIEIKLVNAQNLLSNLDDIVKIDDPELFVVLLKTAVKEIQNQADLQKHPEAREYLQSYINRLDKAIEEIEEGNKFKDMKTTEKAIDSTKMITKDLKSNLECVSKSLDVTDEQYINLIDTIKQMIVGELSFINVLDFNKKILNNIHVMINNEKNLEKRRNLEHYYQQLTETFKALEQSKYSNNPKDEKAKKDVDDLFKKIRDLVTDLLKSLTTVKHEVNTKHKQHIEVKLINIHNLLLILDGIEKNDDTKLFKDLNKTAVKEMQYQADLQENPDARLYLEEYIQKFNLAFKNIEECDKLMDKRKSEIAVRSMKMIAKELKANIEVVTEFNTPDEIHIKKEAMIYEQISTNEFIKKLVEKISLMAAKEKDVNKHKIFEEYVQQLLDAARKLENTEMNYYNNPQNEEAKENHIEASNALMKIISEIQSMLVENSVTSGDDVKEITITLHDAQDLINNVDEIVNNKTNDFNGVINAIVKDIMHQATLQTSLPAKEFLEKYAEEITKALQDLENTERGKGSTKPIQNAEANQELEVKIKIIHKIIERFQKEIILILGNEINETIEQVENGEVILEQKSPNNYLDTQISLVKLWLLKPKMVNNKKSCQDAVTNIIEVAEKVSVDFSGEDKNVIISVISDIKKLFFVCYESGDEEKCRNLIDKILEVKRLMERMVVNRVIDDFIEQEEPLEDIKLIVLYDTNTENRKTLLEEKISALLNQLSHMTSTVRAVVHTCAVGPQLLENTHKAELLAPKLVRAAKLIFTSQPDKEAENDFIAICKEYNESMEIVRDMCDQAVDPLDFVRTAGERMHRLCEGQKNMKDAQVATRTNIYITKLARRVMLVGASESKKTLDPEIEAALQSAQEKLQAAILPNEAEIRASMIPEWTTTTEQILRVAGEVESALGGETIFTSAPAPDQPIYVAAHALHSCVSEWSCVDNDIVEAARRVAVLMAKLNKRMVEDKKEASIRTSKQIVEASSEVSRLARILANECADVRIKNNLLQVCQQIPTISGQLKMLSTVKAHTSTDSNSVEAKEAMVMLVDNAQNLMNSVQSVVKAAAAASVKIQSDRGFARMRWVRARRY